MLRMCTNAVPYIVKSKHHVSLLGHSRPVVPEVIHSHTSRIQFRCKHNIAADSRVESETRKDGRPHVEFSNDTLSVSSDKYSLSHEHRNVSVGFSNKNHNEKFALRSKTLNRAHEELAYLHGKKLSVRSRPNLSGLAARAKISKNFKHAVGVAEQYLADGTLRGNEGIPALTIFRLAKQPNKCLEVLRFLRKIDCKLRVVHYNHVLAGFAVRGNVAMALKLLEEMKERKINPDLHSYSTAISACAKKGDRWETAVDLLRTVQKDGFTPDVVMYSSVITACANGDGSLETVHMAKSLFIEMKSAGLRADVKLYSAVISVCLRAAHLEFALETLREAVSYGMVNTILYSSAISVCAKKGEWKTALELLDEMPHESITPNVITYSAVISACGKEGEWKVALRMLREMQKRGLRPDTIAYSAVISACAKGGGQWVKSVNLLREMQSVNILPNTTTYNAVISACESSRDQWVTAIKLLKEMQNACIKPNTITYNAVISACEKGGQWEMALNLLRQMQDNGIAPDTITYSAAISACGKGAQWELALSLLKEMKSLGHKQDTTIYSAAISACGNAGRVEEALELLQKMKREGIEPNLITYSAAISACAKGGGQYKTVIDLLVELRMLGFTPNAECLSAAISAYGNDGQWRRAVALVESMSVKNNIVVYGSVIEALGKSNMTTLADEYYEDVAKNTKIGWNRWAKLSRTGLLDLHNHSRYMAQAAVRKLLRRFQDNKRCKPFKAIIVGKGNSSVGEPVLVETIQHQLRTDTTPSINSYVDTSKGWLLLDANDLDAWLLQNS
eukprot:CFRG1597T1